MSVTVYGASDDLIEVEGDILEEFSASGEADLLAFSDGTVLRVNYINGVWRIAPVTVPVPETVVFNQAPENDDANYSDRVTLTGPIQWVVHGTAFAGKR